MRMGLVVRVRWVGEVSDSSKEGDVTEWGVTDSFKPDNHEEVDSNAATWEDLFLEGKFMTEHHG